MVAGARCGKEATAELTMASRCLVTGRPLAQAVAGKPRSLQRRVRSIADGTLLPSGSILQVQHTQYDSTATMTSITNKTE